MKIYLVSNALWFASLYLHGGLGRNDPHNLDETLVFATQARSVCVSWNTQVIFIQISCFADLDCRNT